MEDETFHFIFMIGGALVVVWWLARSWTPSHRMVQSNGWRLLLTTSLFINGAIMLYVLRTWASWDVTGSAFYVFSYLCLGYAWVYGSVRVLGGTTDIRLQEDVREHNNLAAAIVIFSLTIGTTLAFSGGNIGDGPGWWVVVFCAVLSTAAVYGVAWAVAVFTDGEERITIDHDAGGAIRLGGAIIAAGLIAGRAVAGDWDSGPATIRDFALYGWPVLVIAGAAVLIERVMPPAYLSNTVPRSLLIAVAYIVAAVFYVRSLGPW